MALTMKQKAAGFDHNKLENKLTKPDHAERAPRSAVSNHVEAVYRDQALANENVKLKDELATFAGSSPTRRLNPKDVVRSKWANRHEESFADAEFELLKRDIESSGGNVQPIKVRPLAGQPGKFEVVFGHRRHQACLDLDLDVMALIDQVSEQALFIEMDRENRQRKDLRPFEQGMMYKRALDEGLFPSARKLAESASIDITNLGKALALARLPTEVLNAFSSPLDLQYRWATELTQALQKDPDLVLSNAKHIQSLNPRPRAKDVLNSLIMGGSTVLPPPPKKISVKGSAGQIGSICIDSSDRSAVVTLKNIDPKRFEELKKMIENFVA